MLVPIFLATIQGGKMSLHQRDRLSRYLSTLKAGLYELTIKRRIKTRSLAQNNYLWGVVYELVSCETGMSPEEVHNFCKMAFLKKRVGKWVTLGSTANLSTLDFSDYVERVRAWAGSELGVVIPDPGEIEIK